MWHSRSRARGLRLQSRRRKLEAAAPQELGYIRNRGKARWRTREYDEGSGRRGDFPLNEILGRRVGESPGRRARSSWRDSHTRRRHRESRRSEYSDGKYARSRSRSSSPVGDVVGVCESPIWRGGRRCNRRSRENYISNQNREWRFPRRKQVDAYGFLQPSAVSREALQKGEWRHVKTARGTPFQQGHRTRQRGPFSYGEEDPRYSAASGDSGRYSFRRRYPPFGDEGRRQLPGGPNGRSRGKVDFDSRPPIARQTARRAAPPMRKPPRSKLEKQGHHSRSCSPVRRDMARRPSPGRPTSTPPQSPVTKEDRSNPAQPTQRRSPTPPGLPPLHAAPPSTYAQVVKMGRSSDVDRPPVRVYETQGRRPVDPYQEGRCLRCLGRDHMIKTCREPVKCRLCLQGGHRQFSCPLKTTASPLPSSVSPGFFACLVGEIRDVDQTCLDVRDELCELSPFLKNINCHKLISGDVFLRGLTKDAWRYLQGRTPRLNGGGTIKWRRPLPTDEAIFGPTEIHRLEVRGVPFCMCSWAPLEKALQPIGALRKILCNGIHIGDPNCLCLDVEMGQDMVVPRKLLVSDNGRFGMEFHIAALPGPLPLPSCPQPASSDSPTAQPEAHPLGQALSQSSANEDAIPSARAQSATPQESLPSPRAAEGETHTAPLGTASPSSPAAVPDHEHASHQSKLSVYQSRRRYQ